MFFPEPDVIQTYWRLKGGTCVCSKLVLLVIYQISNHAWIMTLLSYAGYASWELSLASVKFIYYMVLSAWVAAVKCRPVLHHDSVVIFFWYSGVMDCIKLMKGKTLRKHSLHEKTAAVCCLHLRIEFRSCARIRQWCGNFHYHWCTTSIKPRLLFFHAGYASRGLPLSSVN